MSWAAEKINFVEYVIHHEDVRRGGADAGRAAGPARRASRTRCWGQLGLFAARPARRRRSGSGWRRPTGQTRVAKAGDGVTLTGEPVELALWISGRRDRGARRGHRVAGRGRGVPGLGERA